MAIVEQFITASDFWTKMVEPDYQAYCESPDNLRLALHAAMSLFHIADWVFNSHETDVCSGFNVMDSSGIARPVSDTSSFANALEQQNEDFGRIRGIANASKHLNLRHIRPVANAPSHAANTRVQSIGGIFGDFFPPRYFGGMFGNRQRVMLEGPDGNDLEFSDIANSVRDMWIALNVTHHWW